MRCDSCKHWATDDAWEAQEIGFGWCQAVRERWKICDDERNRSARTEAWRSAAQNALKNSRAYVEDGSEYHAALITGPDFFCALFAKG